MPSKPMVPCSAYPCGERVPVGSGGLCPLHKKERLQGKPKRSKEYIAQYNGKWRRIRARHLAKHPYCVDCGAPATEVDHGVPKIMGGTDQEHNLFSRCKVCHSRKTAFEVGLPGHQSR